MYLVENTHGLMNSQTEETMDLVKNTHGLMEHSSLHKKLWSLSKTRTD